jgi:membrane protein required for colicin V production
MTIDLIYLFLLAMAAYRGFRQGLVMAAFSFTGFFVGLAAAFKLSALVAGWLATSFNKPAPWWPFLAFFLVLVIVSGIIRLAAAGVSGTLNLVMLGWVNKLGGFLLYAVLYTLLFSVVLFYLDNLLHLSPKTLEQSAVYPYIKPWGQWTMDAWGKLLPQFRNVFHDMERFFEQVGRDLAE